MNPVFQVCLLCPAGQKKPAVSRGLCQMHYRRARLQVAHGLTTWPQLVQRGLARQTDLEQGLSRNRRFDQGGRRRGHENPQGTLS